MQLIQISADVLREYFDTGLGELLRFPGGLFVIITGQQHVGHAQRYHDCDHTDCKQPCPQSFHGNHPPLPFILHA